MEAETVKIDVEEWIDFRIWVTRKTDYRIPKAFNDPAEFISTDRRRLEEALRLGNPEAQEVFTRFITWKLTR